MVEDNLESEGTNAGKMVNKEIIYCACWFRRKEVRRGCQQLRGPFNCA